MSQQTHRERKVVTVLFADLVGFTSRAESLDPEDVEAILRPYHERLRSELERRGGTVEKFIGDAVMALFGAPAAHEDDPERAVRAALAIRDWAREEGGLEVRIGITTGEALVSLGARPEAGEGMASGDIVNTAARLQAAAQTNAILVDETTYHATERAIDYRQAEAVEAKGKAEPVSVWEPQQARSRLEVDVRRPRTPLVGRRRETDLLADALARVREESSPQLVTLVGEPGIGKSRLVYELFRTLEAEPELIYWRHGRSLPYGEGVSFWSLGEMVKAQAGILETDTPEDAEEKLRAAVASMEDAEWLMRHLRPLVGFGGEVELGPEREEAFAAWRRFFEELAEERPLVMVFEDLHWADEGLLDFVDHLVDWASGVPILVVGSARPELLERRPGWGGGKRNATTISLSPLSDEETAKVVAALLERPVLAAETQAALLERAGGNPLYAEEFARMLTERGGSEQVPETLQGVIAARLDGLPPEEKSLLQRAAVVGKVFWLGTVEALNGASRRELEAQLHALERKEFVRRERRSSVEGDTEYAFLHVLVRDVAYGQIPRVDRAELHRRAAEWIASLGRSDHAEMLAHHYLQALELAEAAGADTAALIDPARRAFADAGDRAGSLYAVEAAERFYDAALQLWPEGHPERAHLLFRRAVPVGPHLAGGDPERLAEASDALVAVGERAKAAEAEMLLSQRFWMLGRQDLADAHAERAIVLLGDAPPSRSSVWVRARRASRAMVAGDYEQAIEMGSQARDEAGQLGSDEAVSDALATIGSARVQIGDANGLADIDRAIALANSAGALGTLVRAYNNLSVAYQVLADLESGAEARLEAARLAERLGSEVSRTWFQGINADFRYRSGDWVEALELADAVLIPVEAGSFHYVAGQAFCIRAFIRMARDDQRGAVSDAEQALEVARAVPDPQVSNFVLPAVVYVFNLASRKTVALELAREFLAPLARGDLPGFAVINLPLFASAAVRLDLAGELLGALAAQPETEWSKAARAYVSADFVAVADMLRRSGAKPDEAEARLRAAELFAGEGRRAEADEQLQQALAFYRSVGATRYIREGEALLAASA